MTTKVKVECPETSHWNLVVTTEDMVYDNENRVMDVWKAIGSPPVVLKPLESLDTYIYHSRRLIVSEGEPVKQA